MQSLELQGPSLVLEQVFKLLQSCSTLSLTFFGKFQFSGGDIMKI